MIAATVDSWYITITWWSDIHNMCLVVHAKYNIYSAQAVILNHPCTLTLTLL